MFPKASGSIVSRSAAFSAVALVSTHVSHRVNSFACVSLFPLEQANPSEPFPITFFFIFLPIKRWLPAYLNFFSCESLQPVYPTSPFIYSVSAFRLSYFPFIRLPSVCRSSKRYVFPPPKSLRRIPEDTVLVVKTISSNL